MLFTTQIFLFLFFPISLLIYLFVELLSKVKYLNKIIYNCRIKDILLIIFSFIFYMWTSVDNLYRFLIYLSVVYLLGLWIQRKNKNNFSKLKFLSCFNL